MRKTAQLRYSVREPAYPLRNISIRKCSPLSALARTEPRLSEIDSAWRSNPSLTVGAPMASLKLRDFAPHRRCARSPRGRTHCPAQAKGTTYFCRYDRLRLGRNLRSEERRVGK